MNFKEVIIGGNSSHSNAAQDKDNYLALNVIYDDTKKAGYRIEPDTHNDKDVIEHYHKKLFFLNGKPNPKLMTRAREAIKKNEFKVFRVLCKHMHNAIIKGDQLNDSATIKGDQLNDSATIKGDQWNDSAIIEEDQRNNSATIKGDQWNDSATIK